jgi:hypothetical protein
MTLIIQKPTGAKLNLRKTWQPMDPDAAAYITAVETADTEPLEEKTKIAIDNFVLGCKEDGIWTAIKASCILAGARTLNGALVPLVGTAPTNVGGLFVSGDYNRETGLVGNGSTKYLNSNRNNNADPQDSQHLSFYVTTFISGGREIGSGVDAGSSTLGSGGTALGARSRNSAAVINFGTLGSGFHGISRATSSTVNWHSISSSGSFSQTSQTPSNATIEVFRGAAFPSASRLAFYSIGESLNLVLLDARVTDLINAFAAAIP